MINIYQVVNGALLENCYIVTKNSKECILIDPGTEYEKVAKRLTELDLTPIAVLLTHGHYDHAGSVYLYHKNNIPIYIHNNDQEMLSSSIKSLAVMLGESIQKTQPDVILYGEEEFIIADINIKTIHTPGHTSGSVCFIVDNQYMFSGDTIFYLSYGRYDLPSGSKKEIMNSIKNIIFSIKENLQIFPGHYQLTTLDFERENNPILRDN